MAKGSETGVGGVAEAEADVPVVLVMALAEDPPCRGAVNDRVTRYMKPCSANGRGDHSCSAVGVR